MVSRSIWPQLEMIAATPKGGRVVLAVIAARLGFVNRSSKLASP